MKTRRFGSSGLLVSELCFGTMTLGKEANSETSFSLLDCATDHGINFLDCANMYADGESERLLGQWLRKSGNRDRLIVSSKVFYAFGDDPLTRGLSPKTITRELENSLERLQLDYLDIYFLHAPDYNTPIGVTLKCMDDLSRQGKFRSLGLSNFSTWQAVEAIHIARANGWIQPTIIQSLYNVIGREADRELFPMCQRYDVGVCNYNPLAGGLLTGKYGVEGKPLEGRLSKNATYQDRYLHDLQRQAAMRLTALAAETNRTPVEMALHFCLSTAGVSTVLLGASKPEQLKQSLASIKSSPLTDMEQAGLDDIWGQLKGPIPVYNR